MDPRVIEKPHVLQSLVTIRPVPRHLLCSGSLILPNSPDTRSSLALSQRSSAGVISMSHSDAADIFEQAIPVERSRGFFVEKLKRKRPHSTSFPPFQSHYWSGSN